MSTLSVRHSGRAAIAARAGIHNHGPVGMDSGLAGGARAPE